MWLNCILQFSIKLKGLKMETHFGRKASLFGASLATIAIIAYNVGLKSEVAVDGRTVSHMERKLQAVEPDDLLVLVPTDVNEVPSLLRVVAFVPLGQYSYIQVNAVSGNFARGNSPQERQVQVRYLLDYNGPKRNRVYIIPKDWTAEFYGRMIGDARSISK